MKMSQIHYIYMYNVNGLAKREARVVRYRFKTTDMYK